MIAILVFLVFFLIIRRPTRSTLTYTLLPYTTLFRSIRKGLHQLVCIICGMMTATFGGMIRDVLCQKPARILHSDVEIYATTAIAGSACYVGADRKSTRLNSSN